MKEMKENMKMTYKLIVPVAYTLGVLTEKIVNKVKEKEGIASKDASKDASKAASKAIHRDGL